MDLQLKLSGDKNREMANDAGPVSVSRRLNVAQLGTSFSTYGPVPMHERSLEIGEQLFANIQNDLNRIFNTDMPALRKAMDEAGVPWTPGRGVPGSN
jgi:microcystin degradation protein MlrC